MDFYDVFRSMSERQRARVAKQADTTVRYLGQISRRAKRVELGLADVLCVLCGEHGFQMAVTDLPLTDRAIKQQRVRAKFARRTW